MRLMLRALAASSAFVSVECRLNDGDRDAGLPNGLARRLETLRLHAYDVPSTVTDKVSTEAVAAVAEDVAAIWHHPHPLDHPHHATVETFSWGDVNFGTKVGCGNTKCYFESLSDPEHGYLMWEPLHCDHMGRCHLYEGPPPPLMSFAHAEQGYAYAKKLESEFHIRQFLTSPPFETEATPEYLSHEHEGWKTRLPRTAEEAGPLYVQASRTAPEGSVLYKCRGDAQVGGDQSNESLMGISNQDLVELGRGNVGFRERLLEEFEYTLHFLQNNGGLSWDFQIMIDPEGRVYQVDLDRNIDLPAHFKRDNAHGHLTRVEYTPQHLEKIVRCIHKTMGCVRSSMTERDWPTHC